MKCSFREWMDEVKIQKLSKQRYMNSEEMESQPTVRPSHWGRHHVLILPSRCPTFCGTPRGHAIDGGGKREIWSTGPRGIARPTLQKNQFPAVVDKGGPVAARDEQNLETNQGWPCQFGQASGCVSGLTNLTRDLEAPSLRL